MNPFDQFDAPVATAAPPANPFDVFDAKPVAATARPSGDTQPARFDPRAAPPPAADPTDAGPHDEFGLPVRSILPDVSDNQPLPQGSMGFDRAYTPGWDWQMPGQTEQARQRNFVPDRDSGIDTLKVPGQGVDAPARDPKKAYEPAVNVPGQSWNTAVYNSTLQNLTSSAAGAFIGTPGELYRAGQSGVATEVLRHIDDIDQGKTDQSWSVSNPVKYQVAAYLSASPDQRQQMKADLIARAASADQPNAATTLSDNIGAWGQQQFPVATANQGFGTKAGGMAGSFIPMVAAGAALGPEAGLAVAGLQTYHGARAEAVAKGATPQQADQAATYSALSTMGIFALPFGMAAKSVLPELSSGMLKSILETGVKGGEFSVAGAVSQATDNAIKKKVYDPNQSLTEGVLEAGVAGALTGAAFGVPGMVDATGRAINRARQPAANEAFQAFYRAQRGAANEANAWDEPRPPGPQGQLAGPGSTPPGGEPPAPSAPPGPRTPPPGPAAPAGPTAPVPSAPVGKPPDVPSPAAPGPAAPPAVTPTPTIRTPAQIQQAEGVGYNQAVQIQAQEKAAAAAAAAPPAATPPGPHDVLANIAAGKDPQTPVPAAPPATPVAPAPQAAPAPVVPPPVAALPQTPTEPPAAPPPTPPPEVKPAELPPPMEAVTSHAPPAAPSAKQEIAAPDKPAVLPAAPDKPPVQETIPDSLSALTPETVTHTTKKGKVLTGTLRPDLDFAGAKALDPYAFKKDGGWFIRTPASAAAPAEVKPPAEPSAPTVPPAPPAVRTPGQIQQQDGVNFQDAVKIHAQEKQAAAATYVTTPEGSPDLGRIDDTMAAAIGSASAPIRLTRGAEAHIGERQDELAMHGFSSPIDFVQSVATHFSEIWSAGGDSLMLVRRVPADGRERAHSLYVLLQHSDPGRAGSSAYEVQSGGVFRRAYPMGSGRKLLWQGERANIDPAGTDSRTTPHRPQLTGSEPETMHSAGSQSAPDVGNADAEGNKLLWQGERATIAPTDSDSRMPVTNPPGDEAGTGDASARNQREPDVGAPNTEGNGSSGKPDVRPTLTTPDNPLISESRADQIRAMLRAKAAAMRTGVDPNAPGTQLAARPGGMDAEIMQGGAELAVYYLERGVRAFPDYARKMIEDVGEEFRPYLRMWYEGARYYPGLDASDLTPHAGVDAEIARWGQEGTDGPQASGPGDGALVPPGGGAVGQGELVSGRPSGAGTDSALEGSQPANVSAPASGGDTGADGVRPGHEPLRDEKAVPGGGDAANGRGRGSDEGLATDGAGSGPDHELIPAPARTNFHIDDPEALIGGTPKVRFARNRAALDALAAIEDEQRAPSPDELKAMAGYIGWGSFGQELFKGNFDRPLPRPGWDAEAKWLRERLGRDAWNSAQESIANAHYTDPITVKTMWDMVQKMGFKGGRVLEPSMGVGNFFGLMPRDVMANSVLTGIEMDTTTGAMAKLLYPDAGIHIKGYQDSLTPDDFYDLVIGNWPFHQVGPVDRRYDRFSPTLHNYFFLKALDQVRPGGLVVGITAKGTMDSAGRSARLEMARKAELLASFRLPSGAFEKYAGTAVVTDLIVLRKRAEPHPNPSAEPWIASTDMMTPAGQTIRVNRHYQDNPAAVLGTLDFGRGTTQKQPGMIVHRPDNLLQLMQDLPNRVPADGYQPIIRGNEQRFLANNTAARQNNVVIHDNGKLYQVKGDQLQPLDVLHPALRKGTAAVVKARDEQVRGLVGMRGAYGALIDAERDGKPQTEALRKALADQYAAFLAKHGTIGKSEGLKVLDHVKDPGYPVVAALERPDGTPSQILSQPTVRSRRSLDNPSIGDAYVLARNEQVNFDMARVAELAKQPQAAVEQHLLDSGAVMRTPGGGFEPADSYLSGNVRRKLAEAQQALASGETAMQPSIDALTAVVPKTKPYYMIQANLGAAWPGDETYRHFVQDILNLTPDEAKAGIEIGFVGARWKVRIDGGIQNKTEARQVWGHPRVDFQDVLKAAMGNTMLSIYDPKDKDGGPYFNAKASEEANAKVAGLREKFNEWAWQDPLRKVQLEAAYNETMRAVAPARFDGSFMDMSGMALRRGNDPFSLRQHQINAIWRGVVTGRGFFAHEVGTGKTYTMGGIAIEGRRYGVFRKPMLFAHNANSAAVSREIQQMYPGARILYVDNLAPATVKTTLHRVANEDWDLVVMPHSVMDKLALTRATLDTLAAEQIAALESEAIDAAETDGFTLTPEMMDDPEAMKKIRSPTAKDLVTTRKRIKARIDKMALRASEPGAVTFEQLGVDAIMVDEAHVFKKPVISTQMRVKGLNTAASNRSIALDFLTGYTKQQNNGRGVYLFSGTPITNTLNEVFNQARYFMQDRMAAAGAGDWDTWFNTFANAENDVELTAAGTYEPVKRLSQFSNVDELVALMSEFTDVVQAKDMPEFKPRATADGKTLHAPDLTPADRALLTNGRAENAQGRPYVRTINDVGQMSGHQRAILDDVRARVESYRALTGKEKRELTFAHLSDPDPVTGKRVALGPPDPRLPLITESDPPRASLDQRMYDPALPEDPESKTNRVVRNVLRIYQQPKAAQAIFLDTGYNAAKSSEGRSNRFVLVNDLIAKLVKGGIPRSEIALFGGGMTGEQKDAFAKEMSAGTKRIAIGATETMGTGVNMQTLLRAMHHMDAPWMPGDLEQRNGRGNRQGNTWNTVEEYRYITEGLDGKRWQVLMAKDKFIKKFISAFNDKSGDFIGSIEGDATDIGDKEDVLASLSAAAGDPRIMQRAQYRAQVDKLTRRERLHTIGQAEAIQSLHRLKSAQQQHLVEAQKYAGWAKTWQEAVARTQAAQEAMKGTHRLYEAGDTPGIAGGVSSVNPAHGRTAFYRGTDLQDAIDAQVKTLAPGEQRTLAVINGFTVGADWSNQKRTEPAYYIDDAAGTEVGEIQAPGIARIVNRLNSMAGASDAAMFRHGEAAKSMGALDAQAKMDFPQREVLLKKRLQLAKLEDDLQGNPIPPPAWLRLGAPLDSDIHVNGEKRIVRGHRMGDDYSLATDEGDVPYMQAKDENGQPLFEQHPLPPPPKPKAVPEWAKKQVEAAKAELVWHDGDIALLRSNPENGDVGYGAIKKGVDGIADLGRGRRSGFDHKEWEALENARDDHIAREANRAALEAARTPDAPAPDAPEPVALTTAYDEHLNMGAVSLTSGRPQVPGSLSDDQFSRRKGKPNQKPTAVSAVVPAELAQRASDARDRLYTAAQGMMRFLGLPEKVALKFVQNIAVQGGGQADAMYQHALITYALSTEAHAAPSKIGHEAVHALMDPKLGLLNEAQRNALTVGAKRWLYDGKRGVERRRELAALGYGPDKMMDEAIARMGEQYMDASVLPRTATGTAFRAMQNFAQGIGQVLHGEGYLTATDVMRGLVQGKHALPGSREVAADLARTEPQGRPSMPLTDPAGATTPTRRPAVLDQPAEPSDVPQGGSRTQPAEQEGGSRTQPPETTPTPATEPAADEEREFPEDEPVSMNDVLGDRYFALRPRPPVATLTGDELPKPGTPERRKAVFKWAVDNLRGQLVRSDALGASVKINRRGLNEVLSHANESLLDAMPAIPALIAHGDRIGQPEAERHPKTDTATKAWHRLGGTVQHADGRVVPYQIVVREDMNGHFFYDLKPADVSAEPKSSPSQPRSEADTSVSAAPTINLKPDPATSAPDRQSTNPQSKAGRIIPEGTGVSSLGVTPAREVGPGTTESKSTSDNDTQHALRPQPAQPVGPRPTLPIPPPRPMGTARKAVDEIQKWFSPTSREGAKPMEAVIRGRAAMQAQSAAQTGHALERFRHVVNRLSVAEQLDLTHRMETSQPMPSPQLQLVANAIRQQQAAWRQRIQGLGTGALADADESYMGRIYSNYPEWAAGRQAAANSQAQGLSSAVGAGVGKRPIRGSGNFLKARSFDTLQEAMAAGLIPVTTNPIEMQTLKLREMQRYYHGSMLADEIKRTHLARWVPTEREGAARAAGMVKLDDRVFQPTVRADTHGVTSHGNWYAPEPVATVFNNYVSAGMANHSTIYGMVRAAGNLLNAAQLALSGFHASFITLDTMISRMALGIQQVSRGDFGRGAVNMALSLSPHSVVPTVLAGSRLRTAWLDPANATPEMRRLANLLNAGGGRINMDQFYRSNASGSFFKNLNDLRNPDGAFREAWQMLRSPPGTGRVDEGKHIVAGALHIVGRLMDTLLEPLMGQLVPRAKLGVFSHLAADWQRRNPNATAEEAGRAMIGFWDSVDNRMGQMVYDNIFWHKNLKDTAFINTRSVGWNLGTIRELGGGVVDVPRQVAGMAQGKRPEVTTGMAYCMGMTVLSAALGAVITYLYTGHGPQEMLDYFYPPTGTATNGVKDRISFPGYIKDVIAYAHAPVQTLLNKTHPLISLTSQLYYNRDYYGGIIDHPTLDNPWTAYPEYLLNQALPFSIRGAQHLNAAGASKMQQMMAFWGFNPAPTSIANPERGEAYQQRLDNQAYKIRERNRALGR